MYNKIKDTLKKELHEIKDAGLYKSERIITSSQDALIQITTGEEVLNFCANNYLGLSNHPEVIQAAKDTWMLMVLECHRYALFAEHKIFTNN